MKSSFTKLLILLSGGVVLTILTVVLGAIPMRLVRQTHGRGAFWLAHMVVAAGLFATGLTPFAIAFSMMVVLIGLHAEIEPYFGTLFAAGSSAIAVAAGVGAAALAVWLHQTKADLLGVLKGQVSAWVAQVATVNPQASLDVDALVRQTPSAILVMLALALAAGLIGERRGYRWFRLSRLSQPTKVLSDFRVPDVFVWLTMLALLGAFLQHGRPLWETVSLNVLNVLVLLYFFQGLAVVARFFAIIRLSPVWQGFWYIVIAFQLFLLVALIGFVDFWMEFRVRLAKKTTEMKNKSI